MIRGLADLKAHGYWPIREVTPKPQNARVTAEGMEYHPQNDVIMME
jgi:hypothetical protein